MSSAILDLEQLSRVDRACNPMQPLFEEPGTFKRDAHYYVQLDKQGLRGGQSVQEQLIRQIRFASDGEAGLVLFTGLIGTGKTTELHLTRRVLEQKQDHWCPYVAMSRYLGLREDVGIVDVLAGVAVGLTAEVGRLYTQSDEAWIDWVAGRFQRLGEAVTRLRGDDLAISGEAEVDLKVVKMKIGGSFKPKLADSQLQQLRKRAGAMIDEFQQLVTDYVRELLDDVTVKLGPDRKVVLFVDDLEKIGAGAQRERRERAIESIEQIFIHGADRLRLPCTVVYTYPPLLSLTADLHAASGQIPLFLPMCRVHHRIGDPAVEGVVRYEDDEEGLEAMADALRKRIGEAELPAFFAEPDRSLAALARASGGYFRDLLLMTKRVVLWAKPGAPIEHELVERAINRHASEAEARLRGDLTDVLARAEVEGKFIAVDRDEQVRLFTVLELHQLLRYENADFWYAAHPLLREHSSLRGRIEDYIGR